ncbi:calcium-binding protein [Mangrovicoccus algicola]|uniref:Calcium-binding protein n=1 Tax=Mangrovicoccus algicola TaxID=2771008 RepID=A0A8J7CVV3_9RHOB|nr:calcium-binding protein [Mangrovicoccus algicola]MBE3636912.1 hypothetical protein [Mangrovicoccus algicola]
MTADLVVTDATLDLLTNRIPGASLRTDYGMIALEDGPLVRLATTRIDGAYGLSALMMEEDGSWSDSFVPLVASGAANEMPMAVQATALSGGGFMLSWTSYDGATRDYSFIAQAFGADGRPAAGPVVLDSGSDNLWHNADLEELSSGEVVAVWHSSANGSGGVAHTDPAYGVFGQRLAADGTPLGEVFEIDAFNDDAGDEVIGYGDRIFDPDLVALGDGAFMVTWWENDSRAGDAYRNYDYDVHGQLFDAAGAKYRGDISIMTEEREGDNDMVQSVSAAQTDGTVVTVARSGPDYYLRAMAPDGTWSGTTLLAEYLDRGDLAEDVTVAALSDGRFLAAWTVFLHDGDGRVVDARIMGRYLAANGRPEGNAEILLNGGYEHGDVTYWYSAPQITALQDGGFALSLEASISSVEPVFLFTADDTVITGTDGNDRLEGDGDAETYTGLAGDDLITARGGADTVWGGSGDDTISGNAGGDRLDGGTGNDLIRGGLGDDTITAGEGDDMVQGDAGRDSIDLGAGNDLFLDNGETKQAGRDTVSGGAGDDTILADGGMDKIDGGDGDDLIMGGQGIDAIRGGRGADTLFGGNGSDRISGGFGADLVDMGAGNDIYTDVGQGGADGRDTVNGGDGRDVIGTAGGDDLLTGGAGADVFEFHKGFGDVTITDFETGSDRIDLRNLPGTSGAPEDGVTMTETAQGLHLAGDWLGGGTILLSGLDAAGIGQDDFLYAIA